MRTGKVVVEGDAMNTVIVTSSNDVMKANTQPETTPGSIRGNVTRRNTANGLAPSETAACSTARSSPVEAASTSLRANGITITMWDRTSPRNVPPSPITVKKRRKAKPSTTGGIISGDMNSASTAARPTNRYRAIASAAGTDSSTAIVEESAASQSESRNARTNSG